LSQADPAATAIAARLWNALVTTIRPFVEQKLRLALGEGWRLRSGLVSPSGEASSLRSLDDPAELLDQLTGREVWSLVASEIGVEQAARVAKDQAFTLKELRNRWAHMVDFEARDVIALGATIRRLLMALGLMDARIEAELDLVESETGALLDSRGVEGLTDLRHAYAESIRAAAQHIDLAGISPAADASMVRIRLGDVFVEPALTTEGSEVTNGEARAADLKELVARRHLAILGSPGSGKSTLVRYLARDSIFSAAQPYVPIVVRGSVFGRTLQREPSLSLRQFVERRHTDRYGPLFREAIADGNAWIFIDGLDEAGDGRARRNISEAIEIFCSDNPDVKIWLTSRPVGFDLGAAGPRFALSRIAPFDRPRIVAFSSRWQMAMARQDPGDNAGLGQEILSSPALEELAGNPLLLTILALLWQRGSRLPQRRAELYRVSTETMLRDWPIHRLGTDLDMATVMAVLQPVASSIVATGEDFITEPVLMGLATDALVAQDGMSRADARRQARRFIDTIQETTGFFVDDGSDDSGRVYRFLHRTFAEFLAAQQLLEDWGSGRLDLRRYLHKPEWATTVELLLEYAASLSPGIASALTSAILDLDWPIERHLHGNLRLVLAALGRGVRVNPAVRDAAVASGVEMVVASPALDMAAARLLAQAIVSSRSTVHVQPLLEQSSDDTAVRARKAVCRYEIDPSGTNLARVISDWPAVLTGLRLPRQSVASLFDRLNEPGPQPTTMLIVHPFYWRWVTPAKCADLHEAGIPLVPLVDAFGHEAIRESGPLLVDVSGELTVEDIVAFNASPLALNIGEGLIPSTEWQLRHEAQIRALAEDAPNLPPDLAIYCLHAYFAVDAELASHWISVLTAMVFRGTHEGQVAALRAVLDLAEEGSDELLAAVVHEIASNKSELLWSLAEAMAGFQWIEALKEGVEAMLRSDETRLRGIASRFLAGHETGSAVLTLLAEPAAIAPALAEDGSLLGEPEMTMRVVQALMGLDDGDQSVETQGAIRTALERVIAVAPHPASTARLGPFSVLSALHPSPYGKPHPVSVELARTLVLSDRAETRAWAADILGIADRGSATDELELLLADGDPHVVERAVHAIHGEDLEDPEWIRRQLPAVLSITDATTAAYLAQILRDELDETEVQALAEIVEVELAAGRSSGSARAFASTLLLFEPWTTHLGWFDLLPASRS
jgi:hypothetical protein